MYIDTSGYEPSVKYGACVAMGITSWQDIALDTGIPHLLPTPFLTLI